MKAAVERKFPTKVKAIEKFLTVLSFELEYSPEDYDGVPLFETGDNKDYIVLHSAIIAEVDILITGDMDFENIEIERPEIMTPKEFSFAGIHDSYINLLRVQIEYWKEYCKSQM